MHWLILYLSKEREFKTGQILIYEKMVGIYIKQISHPTKRVKRRLSDKLLLY
jgi:hypothetical protein